MVANNDKFEEIDSKKVEKIWRRIYWLERKNLKTANVKDKEMRKKIEEIIEGEVDKCF